MPLLSINCQRLSLLFFCAWLMLITGCRSVGPTTYFYASGYIDDNGVMRIWRKDTNKNQPMGIESVFYSYTGEAIVTRYHFFNGQLSQLERRQQGESSVTEQLRFDDAGQVVFMQRQLAERKEMLSASDISELNYYAAQLVTRSDALREGGVRLIQGWYENGTVTTCAGDKVNLDFDASTIKWLTLQALEHQRLGIAWLVSMRDTQLILGLSQNLCADELNADDF